MNAELKAKWIAALRSGDYKQGSGRLCDPVEDSYCCLGVLCVVAGISREEIETGSVLPSSLEAGVPGTTESFLIGMNDADRKPFTEIADWIEANL